MCVCLHWGYGTITTVTGLAKIDASHAHCRWKARVRSVGQRPHSPHQPALSQRGRVRPFSLSVMHPIPQSPAVPVVFDVPLNKASICTYIDIPSECMDKVTRPLHFAFPRCLQTLSYNLPGLMFAPRSSMKINMISTNLSVSQSLSRFVSVSVFVCLFLCNLVSMYVLGLSASTYIYRKEIFH